MRTVKENPTKYFTLSLIMFIPILPWFCTVHKLRSILSKIRDKRKNRKKLIRQTSEIFKSKTKKEVIVRYNQFLKDWSVKEPEAVKTIRKDWVLLCIFQFPWR